MKKYLENNLMPNETIVKEAKFTKAIFALSILFLIGAITMIKDWDSFVVYLVLAIIAAVPGLYYNLSNTLAFTNKNVIGKTGLIKQNQLASPIDKIQNIQVKNGILGKLFRYGTINITTASGIYSFKYIRKPNEFKKSLLAQISISEENKMDVHAEKIAEAINNINK